MTCNSHFEPAVTHVFRKRGRSCYVGWQIGVASSRNFARFCGALEGNKSTGRLCRKATSTPGSASAKWCWWVDWRALEARANAVRICVAASPVRHSHLDAQAALNATRINPIGPQDEEAVPSAHSLRSLRRSKRSAAKWESLNNCTIADEMRRTSRKRRGCAIN